MRVLIACEFSGIVRDAFLKLGFDAVSCDLLDTERPGPHVKGDVRDILCDGWDLMIAHPPCTYLSAVGSRYWKYRAHEQQLAIQFFLELANAPIKRIAIENPSGIMSTVYRKPDQYIEPWWFGSERSKRTGLWLKNLPKLRPTKIVDNHCEWILKVPCNKDRWKIRSRTDFAIAEAMACQWTSNYFYQTKLNSE